MILNPVSSGQKLHDRYQLEIAVTQTTCTVAKSLNVTFFGLSAGTGEPLVLITGFNGILCDDDDAADIGSSMVELDDNDRRPAELARSLNFCEKPKFGGFMASEWWAIMVADSGIAVEFSLDIDKKQR